MNGFYDKIILAVGVVALAGSAAYYATAMKTEVGGKTSPTPYGADYETLASKEITADFKDWQEPSVQDEAGLEKYDLFTPPKIWWDTESQTFIFVPPEGEKPPPPSFGLQLASFEQDLYRIQFEAYFEPLEGGVKNSSIQLYDFKTDTSFRGKVGESFAEHDAEILDFKVEVINREDGRISRVPSVTIMDKESGEKITLTTEERLYIPNSYKLTFKTQTPYPVETWVWEEAGVSKAIANVTFKLLDFDFDKQTATVEKTFADEEYPTEEKILSVAETKPAETTTQPNKTQENLPQEENPTGIDSLFQN